MQLPINGNIEQFSMNGYDSNVYKKPCYWVNPQEQSGFQQTHQNNCGDDYFKNFDVVLPNNGYSQMSQQKGFYKNCNGEVNPNAGQVTFDCMKPASHEKIAKKAIKKENKDGLVKGSTTPKTEDTFSLDHKDLIFGENKGTSEENNGIAMMQDSLVKKSGKNKKKKNQFKGAEIKLQSKYTSNNEFHSNEQQQQFMNYYQYGSQFQQPHYQQQVTDSNLNFIYNKNTYGQECYQYQQQQQQQLTNCQAHLQKNDNYYRGGPSEMTESNCSFMPQQQFYQQNTYPGNQQGYEAYQDYYQQYPNYAEQHYQYENYPIQQQNYNNISYERQQPQTGGYQDYSYYYQTEQQRNSNDAEHGRYVDFPY